MRHPSLRKLDRPITVMVIAAVACLSCIQGRRGLEPPDLTEQRSEVAQTIEKLDRLEATMADEIAELGNLEKAFFDEQPSAWAPPFPLDVFKHTSMSCLNAPYVEASPEPSLQETASRLGISCAVPAAQVLETRLSEAPSTRQFGLRKLRQIDEIRSVRARLQGRLRQLPSITRRTRAYLASRRAEARQMSEELQRRRPEYLNRDFGEATRRIEAYRTQLDELEGAIAEVEKSIPRWSKTLGSVVDALYKDLSRLGHG